MEFLTLAITHFVALFVPGADFFIIIHTALNKPLKYAVSLCLGLAVAHRVYLSIAVLGIEGIKDIPVLIKGFRVLGGAYLLYLGYQLLKSPKTDMKQKKMKI